MKTRFLAWLYAAVVTLAPSIAWAQIQPTPVQPANGDQITHSVEDVTTTTAYCLTMDMTGYSDMSVIVYNSDAAVMPTYTCAEIVVETWNPVSGVTNSLAECTATPTGLPTAARINSSVTITASGFSEFLVGGINRKVTVRVTYRVAVGAGSHCSGYVKLIPLAFPSTPAVSGVVATGKVSTGVYPVVVGGSDGTYVRTLKTDVYGALATVGNGGLLSLGAETLVQDTATAMPTAATAKSITLHNAGTKDVFCGFANTVTTATGIKVGVGQGITFDFSAVNQTVYCIAASAQTGTGVRTVLSTAPDTVRIFGGGGGGSSTSTDYAPGVPTNVSCSANVSCAITGLTAGKTYQFDCNADFAYRHGASTPTAVTTDNDAKAGVMYRQMLPTGSTALAFISSSAMVCKAGLVPDS